MKYLVYVDETYYPWAEWIEADSPEDAARLADPSAFTRGDTAIVVSPADATTSFGPEINA